MLAGTTEWLRSNRHYPPSGEGEDSKTLTRSLFHEKVGLSTKDSIAQVYGTIRELVTPSLVRCILTAQSLCCSLYSHRFFLRHIPPASDLVGGKTSHTYILSYCHSFGGKFVRRKSIICLCIKPPTSVLALFGDKLRRRYKRSHSSDTAGSPLISLQFMSCSVKAILHGGFGRKKVLSSCSLDTLSVLGTIHFSSIPSANTSVCGNLSRRKTTSLNSTAVLEILIPPSWCFAESCPYYYYYYYYYCVCIYGSPDRSTHDGELHLV